MKTKLVASLFAGIAFVLAAFAIIAVVSPYARAQDVTLTSDNSTTETTVADLWAVLRQVRSEIQDPDTASYYDKLISAYNLPQGSDNETADDLAVYADLENIQETATLLPLQQAGQGIQDPDIAKFYYNYLDEAGLSANVTAATGP